MQYRIEVEHERAADDAFVRQRGHHRTDRLTVVDVDDHRRTGSAVPARLVVEPHHEAHHDDHHEEDDPEHDRPEAVRPAGAAGSGCRRSALVSQRRCPRRFVLIEERDQIGVERFLGTAGAPGAAHGDASVANHAWSITMAAALSMTERAALPLRPAAVRDRCASTVLRRSSTVATVTPRGAKRSRSDSISARADRAAGPDAPERLSGRPTTTTFAPTSSTAAMMAR